MISASKHGTRITTLRSRVACCTDPASQAPLNELFLILIFRVALTTSALWFSLWFLMRLPPWLYALISEWIFRLSSFKNMGFTHQGEGCPKCSSEALPTWRTWDSFAESTSSSHSWLLAFTLGCHLGYFFLCVFHPTDAAHCHGVTSDSYAGDLLLFLNLRPLDSVYQSRTLEKASERRWQGLRNEERWGKWMQALENMPGHSPPCPAVTLRQPQLGLLAFPCSVSHLLLSSRFAPVMIFFPASNLSSIYKNS